jgi:hypothetical protein
MHNIKDTKELVHKAHMEGAHDGDGQAHPECQFCKNEFETLMATDQNKAIKRLISGDALFGSLPH